MFGGPIKEKCEGCSVEIRGAFSPFVKKMHSQWEKVFFCNFSVAFGLQVVHISIRRRHGASPDSGNLLLTV